MAINMFGLRVLYEETEREGERGLAGALSRDMEEPSGPLFRYPHASKQNTKAALLLTSKCVSLRLSFIGVCARDKARRK